MAEGRSGGGPRVRRRVDSLAAPYVLLLAAGLISLLVIVLAFGELVQGTAPWSHVTARAHVQGVYRYDPDEGRVTSGPHRTFSKGQAFAGRVAWSSLPGGLDVGARWFDDGGEDWGGIQPSTASGLVAGGDSLVPMVRTNAPPGTYTLDVMRYTAGRPVQILGSTEVRVRA